jgi:hypothetical protein
MHPRIATRAVEPRYSLPEAAAFIARPTSTVRRWSLGNVRTQKGAEKRDDPLITPDGAAGGAIPLSFLNLLELRFLASYRSRVPLQSIRRALDYAAVELGVDRPLLTVEFKAHGKSLFLKYADAYLNASNRGQLAWPAALDEFISAVDYDPDERIAYRWWPLGRDEPVIVDTLLNAGRPSTSLAGVRTRAIAARERDELSIGAIAYDVGASEDEVRAALKFERLAS